MNYNYNGSSVKLKGGSRISVKWVFLYEGLDVDANLKKSVNSRQGNQYFFLL